MKITPLLFALLLASLTACSTPRRHSPRTPPAETAPPETVIVYYDVKPGQEAALKDALARAWAIYQKEQMVCAQPHMVVRQKEMGGPNDGKSTFVEIFSWTNHAAPLHAPDSVNAVWTQLQSLCEPRDGHPGFYGGVVDLLTPAAGSAQPRANPSRSPGPSDTAR